MASQPEARVTELLDRARRDGERAEPEVFKALYEDLAAEARRLVAAEAPSHTLQATAVLNEACARLLSGESVEWKDTRHAMSATIKAMQNVLIDHARAKKRKKRGGAWGRVSLENLNRGTAAEFPPDQFERLVEELQRLSRTNADWVEVVRLRVFVGLTIAQTAEVMSISPAQVTKYWRFVRAHLLSALE